MVRFIIFEVEHRISQPAYIYIPIWLDLLSADLEAAGMNRLNLHSNMVRFIIIGCIAKWFSSTKFTFQYG